MKKFVGLALLGLVAFNACDQGLSVSEKNEAPSVIRASNDARYGDGDYDLYFRNGAQIHNDCDGYYSTPHGKTIVYEYWQSDIKKWSKLLSGAGIPHETYKTSKVGKYCSVTFDSDLLYGVGYVGRSLSFLNDSDKYVTGQIDLRIKDGKNISLGLRNEGYYIPGAYFAPAYGKFYFDEITNKECERVFNIEQKTCDHAKLLIEVFDGLDIRKKTEEAAKKLKDAGANVIGTKMIPGIVQDNWFVVVAASSIDWFAIGL